MDTESIASVISQFSSKFCYELDKEKSVVSSPLSAEFVLALLTLGTTGPAHAELLAALGIPDDDSIRFSFSLLSSKINAVKDVTMNVANKVYVMEGDYELLPQLKEDAVKVFDAAFEKVDFGNSVVAADLVNKWVESKTNSKIKDLLEPDSLNAQCRLILINAIYFKGSWAKKFSVEDTREMEFHVNSTTTLNVPMMCKKDNYKHGYFNDLNAQVLEMPYAGGEVSMLFVLPNAVEGLDDILKKMAEGYDLMSEFNKKNVREVIVYIPKFKIETKINLNVILQKLGIVRIFDENDSGLTKILNSPEPLFVSDALQKAFIEVNEEGAEATAATSKRIIKKRCCKPPPEFCADRPFLFLLISRDRTPYFVGCYRGV